MQDGSKISASTTSAARPAIRRREGKIERRHQTLKNRILLENYYLPGALEVAVGDFVDHYNHRRVHESLGNVTPAESLRLIAREGAAALHGGALVAALVARVRDGEAPGWLSEADLADDTAVIRKPIIGTYRDHEIIGPPPPSSGVHIPQMLNIIEHLDVAGAGFGSAAGLSVVADVIAVGMADRAAASGDPAFVDVPVARYTSKEYARECFERITVRPAAAAQPPDPPNTTHVTIADRDGLVVTATHTINGIFGARIMVPEAGFIPNNYMMNFDPHPGRALSVAPGKRVPTSMAPMVIRKDGEVRYALGLPGGIRIFTSAFQAILNLINHRMSLQEAVEAARLWTEGHAVELEKGYAAMEEAVARNGRPVRIVPHIGGGMNAIAIAESSVSGAACWRADGTVGALAGGLAQPGVRFFPNTIPDDDEKAKPQ